MYLERQKLVQAKYVRLIAAEKWVFLESHPQQDESPQPVDIQDQKEEKKSFKVVTLRNIM